MGSGIGRDQKRNAMDFTAARERMVSIVMKEDPAPFKREEAICTELIPLEDEILAKISAD